METGLDDLAFLRGISIFAGATNELLHEIREALVDLEFPAGAAVFRAGDYGDSMYIIQEGCVRIHVGDHTLATVGKGSFFGEMAVLDSETRSASVTAVSTVKLWCLYQQPFYALMDKSQGVAHEVIRLLCERLRLRIKSSFDDFTYLQQFSKVTDAAVALEEGRYQPEILNEVVQRTDPLGQLARTFRHMAQEVYNREQALKKQVQELKIEIDQVKLAHQISQITETDNFSDIKAQARDLREKRFASTKPPVDVNGKNYQ